MAQMRGGRAGEKGNVQGGVRNLPWIHVKRPL